MFFSKRKITNDEENILKSIDPGKIPQHIAVIMDGNGRWAKKKNMPRVMGHRAGVEAVRNIVKASSNIGVKYLTLYTFSTENWKRPSDEVNALMSLLVEYLKKEIEELHQNNVIVNTIGDINALPGMCRDELKNAYEKTRNNTGLRLNLALNYGGRDEIKNAVQKIAKQVKDGTVSIEEISEETISANLYTSSIPDPDIVIRPSGEYRISNFLIWQIAYSELWFTELYWPDFKPYHLYKAILDFQNRDRRFGNIK
jgi:undecaprenyl diphosphate synthase